MSECELLVKEWRKLSGSPYLDTGSQQVYLRCARMLESALAARKPKKWRRLERDETIQEGDRATLPTEFRFSSNHYQVFASMGRTVGEWIDTDPKGGYVERCVSKRNKWHRVEDD